jgi:hypothetical protein
MRLEEHGLMQLAPRCRNRRIEAFQMPRLHDAIMCAGQLKDAVSVGEVRGQRFLDEQVDSSGQQWRRSRGVMHRWDADGRSIQLAGRGETRFNALESRNAKLLRCRSQRRWVTIHYTSQLDSLTSLLQLAIDTKVIAPKGSSADDSGSQWLRGGHYFEGAGASTA